MLSLRGQIVPSRSPVPSTDPSKIGASVPATGVPAIVVPVIGVRGWLVSLSATRTGLGSSNR